MWAQASVLCEEKQSAEMLRLGGGWWEGGAAAIEKTMPDVSPEAEQKREEEWKRDVHESLQSLKTVTVEEGDVIRFDLLFSPVHSSLNRASADHAFHVSQIHIVMDQTDTLLDIFASGLRDGSYDPNAPE